MGDIFDNAFETIDRTFEQMDKTFAKMDEVFNNDFFKSTKEVVSSILSFAGEFPTFPPVNVFAFRQTTNAEKHKDSPLNECVVELALSGYKSDDVDVSVQTVSGINFLTIESKGINERIGSSVKWYQRGIAGRAFKMKFMIAHNVKVSKAVLEDGLLSISLTVDNPGETNKIQKINLTKK